ncbi:MAG TPA: beta-hydroxyacyl-ACP dehydratase [Phycisphaeraceae bacterium]|nr:beta-hydroxyacyl-ACP dehydratase [Phycisphaeraceae bacterium]
MRWMWIDRILELEPGKRMVAMKNVTLAEDYLHDHFPEQNLESGKSVPALPVMPACFIVEGMAQTAGILVGQASDFREKVILAKIPRAELDFDVFPGQTLLFRAEIERLDPMGASTRGTVLVLDHHADGSVNQHKLGEIDIFFSHIDQNMAGVEFPEDNFVFGDNFRALLAASDIPELSKY